MDVADIDTAQRKLTAQAAHRIYEWVTSADLPVQVSLDIGILIGRLSYFEGPGWLREIETHEEPTV